MAFRTRIRAVRFKSGGYIIPLPSQREAVSDGLWDELQDVAGQMWDRNHGKIAGFALVAWTADGDAGGHINNARTSPHPISMIPGMVQKSVERVITKVQVNRMIGCDDNEDAS